MVTVSNVETGEGQDSGWGTDEEVDDNALANARSRLTSSPLCSVVEGGFVMEPLSDSTKVDTFPALRMSTGLTKRKGGKIR